MKPWLIAPTALFCFAGTGPSFAKDQAVAPPNLSIAEATQVMEAAGYKFASGRAVNMCGNPAKPKFSYIDLNGDGYPEAVATDRDEACFGGDFISVVYKKKTGKWGWLFRTEGTIAWEKATTNGWRNARITTTCDIIWTYSGTTYSPKAACPEVSVGATPAPDAMSSIKASSAYDPAFVAAGFKKVGGKWTGCDGESSAEIAEGDVRDLNRDGVADLIITEYSSACYGNTGQGFYLLTKGANNTWRLLFSNSGVPTFLNSPVKGWQDVEIGGPGFCFPVLRWNGKTYALLRRQAKSSGGCMAYGQP